MKIVKFSPQNNFQMDSQIKLIIPGNTRGVAKGGGSTDIADWHVKYSRSHIILSRLRCLISLAIIIRHMTCRPSKLLIMRSSKKTVISFSLISKLFFTHVNLSNSFKFHNICSADVTAKCAYEMR